MAAILCAVVTGCGAPSADLFEVRRSGADRNANVDLVVNDSGTVRCNRGEPKALEGDQLLQARELARDLGEQAALGVELPAGPRSILRYRVRTEHGSVAFADTSRSRPRSFDRLAAFTADVAENVCGIER